MAVEGRHVKRASPRRKDDVVKDTTSSATTSTKEVDAAATAMDFDDDGSDDDAGVGKVRKGSLLRVIRYLRSLVGIMVSSRNSVRH